MLHWIGLLKLASTSHLALLADLPRDGGMYRIIGRKHPSRDVIFSGQNFGQKMPKMISLHDVLEPLKQALLASRDVIISSRICGSNLQKVFTLGDGCWLPISGLLLAFFSISCASSGWGIGFRLSLRYAVRPRIITRTLQSFWNELAEKWHTYTL